MIFSTLGVIIFASLSHGLNFNSLLGIGADSTFVGGDGNGNEGNIDLTTRWPKSLLLLSLKYWIT